MNIGVRLPGSQARVTKTGCEENCHVNLRSKPLCCISCAPEAPDACALAIKSATPRQCKDNPGYFQWFIARRVTWVCWINW